MLDAFYFILYTDGRGGVRVGVGEELVKVELAIGVEVGLYKV